jgi:hypothetical protein
MFDFKIWNQANNGTTMGIRGADVNVVAQLGPQFNRGSDDGVYGSLGEYLSAVAVAQTPPDPYRRSVDILWRTAIGYGSHRYFTDRVLEVTYTGNVRQSGGFAAQCYVIVDPNGFQALGPHHTVPISVVVFHGNGARDLLEVTV